MCIPSRTGSHSESCLDLIMSCLCLHPKTFLQCMYMKKIYHKTFLLNLCIVFCHIEKILNLLQLMDTHSLTLFEHMKSYTCIINVLLARLNNVP